MTMAKYIRWTAAGLLVMHGGIDALGFFSAWDLAKIEEIGGPSFLLDSLEAGHPAIIAFGLLWLVAMVGFMTALLAPLSTPPGGFLLQALRPGSASYPPSSGGMTPG